MKIEEKIQKRIIFTLFFASGISGLIYEVVWLRILTRTIGVTAYATAVTLAAFMAGLALGSYLFGRIVDKRNDQLKIFSMLQMWLAVSALITPFILMGSVHLYKFISIISHQNTFLISFSKIAISFVSMLLPTMLMGGTLPALTSYLVKNGGIFGKNFSLLYGLNTLGSVLGVLLSGFVTIGAIGEWNTIFIAAALNLIIAFISFALYRNKTGLLPKKDLNTDAEDKIISSQISIYPDNIRRIVLFVFLMSGFTALAYEVIWTRQLILYLFTSIYAFSGMLAVFLTGVALGSVLMNRLVDRIKTPLVIFAILELLVGILSIINLYLFGKLDGSLLTGILSPFILVFPLTFIFGAIFPIASLCYTRSSETAGTSVGLLYAFNAIGNVAGSLLTGFLFITFFGSSNTVILLGFINIILGFILLWLEPGKSRNFKLSFAAVLPVVLILVLGFKNKDPFLDVIENRIAQYATRYEIYSNKETIEGTVTSFIRDGNKHLLVNGYGQTTLCTETKIMAHLPMMLAGNPKKMLVICFGMGTTVRSASIYDDLKIDCVELVPEVYKCFPFYHTDARKIISRQNNRFIANDGRNFLLLSPDKYDIIIVDPSPPVYNAGTVNLYSQEFLKLCENHLTPDGVMCLWFPGGSSEDNLAICKTFNSVFSNMTIWKGPRGWGFYLMGTCLPTNIDISKIEKAFTNPRLIEDLSEFDNVCQTGSQLMNLLLMRDGKRMDEMTQKAPIITDNYPYTEFPLWRNLFRKEKNN